MVELTKIMKEKNITTQDLAEMTGIAKRTIESYRTGRREPSLSAGLKMADALRVDPHRLLAEQSTDTGRDS